MHRVLLRLAVIIDTLKCVRGFFGSIRPRCSARFPPLRPKPCTAASVGPASRATPPQACCATLSQAASLGLAGGTALLQAVSATLPQLIPRWGDHGLAAVAAGAAAAALAEVRIINLMNVLTLRGAGVYTLCATHAWIGAVMDSRSSCQCRHSRLCVCSAKCVCTACSGVVVNVV